MLYLLCAKHCAQCMEMLKRTILTALREVQFEGSRQGADWSCTVTYFPVRQAMIRAGAWGQNSVLGHKVVESTE